MLRSYSLPVRSSMQYNSNMQSVNLCDSSLFMCPLHSVENNVGSSIVVGNIQSFIRVQRMFPKIFNRWQQEQRPQMRYSYDKHSKKCTLLALKNICWHRHHYRHLYTSCNNNSLLGTTMTTNMQVTMMGKLTIILSPQLTLFDMHERGCECVSALLGKRG